MSKSQKQIKKLYQSIRGAIRETVRAKADPEIEDRAAVIGVDLENILESLADALREVFALGVEFRVDLGPRETGEALREEGKAVAALLSPSIPRGAFEDGESLSDLSDRLAIGIDLRLENLSDPEDVLDSSGIVPILEMLDWVRKGPENDKGTIFRLSRPLSTGPAESFEVSRGTAEDLFREISDLLARKVNLIRWLAGYRDLPEDVLPAIPTSLAVGDEATVFEDPVSRTGEKETGTVLEIFRVSGWVNALPLVDVLLEIAPGWLVSGSILLQSVPEVLREAEVSSNV